jgi:hypothetical protein
MFAFRLLYFEIKKFSALLFCLSTTTSHSFHTIHFTRSFCVFSREILEISCFLFSLAVWLQPFSSKYWRVSLLSSLSTLLLRFFGLLKNVFFCCFSSFDDVKQWTKNQRMREKIRGKNCFLIHFNYLCLLRPSFSAAWNFSLTKKEKINFFLTRSFHAGCDVTAVIHDPPQKLKCEMSTSFCPQNLCFSS